LIFTLISLPDLVRQSAAHTWLWHDPQAALLAIFPTTSHTAAIWILAPFALKFGQSFEAEAPNRCKTARQRNKLSCA